MFLEVFSLYLLKQKDTKVVRLKAFEIKYNYRNSITKYAKNVRNFVTMKLAGHEMRTCKARLKVSKLKPQMRS